MPTAPARPLPKVAMVAAAAWDVVLLALAPEAPEEVAEASVPEPVVDVLVSLTAVNRVVLPTVLVDTSEPEVMVVSTASVLYALDEVTTDSLAPVSEAAVYKVVLPSVLVMTLESEVIVVTTASVE